MNNLEYLKSLLKETLKQKYKVYKKLHRLENREYYLKYKRDNARLRAKIDPSFKIAGNLRHRLWNCVKNGSAVKDLGCSPKELQSYLESKFTEGMSWDNYGEWHIDHIKPLSKFNLEDRSQFLEACHFSNLQPLWAADNIKKSNK